MSTRHAGSPAEYAMPVGLITLPGTDGKRGDAVQWNRLRSKPVNLHQGRERLLRLHDGRLLPRLLDSGVGPLPRARQNAGPREWAGSSYATLGPPCPTLDCVTQPRVGNTLQR